MPKPSKTAKPPARHLLLLRAINVGQRQLPMAALREMALGLGWTEPQTYLASGNLVAGFTETPAAAARRLETAITEHFGFHSDVIVRSAAQWAAYLPDNPFTAASATEPNRVMLLLAEGAPAGDAVEKLQARAAPDEALRGVRDGVWIHFAQGAGASKLTPAFIDKCIGAPATARNWRTVQALHALLQGQLAKAGSA